MSNLITFSNVHKKLKGLQTARQYELNQSKKRKKALDQIEDYIKNFRMYKSGSYSDEVIAIKLKVMDIIEKELNE